MQDLRRVLLTTADPRPEGIEEDGDVCEPTEEPLYALFWGLPVAWRDVPEGPQAIPIVGYGAVTPETAEAAMAVLRGEAQIPERPDEDAYFAQDDALRNTTHEVYTAPGDDGAIRDARPHAQGPRRRSNRARRSPAVGTKVIRPDDVRIR